MMMGLVGMGAPAAALVSSYQTHAEDTTDLTTYSFATQAIGTASATRYVLVVASGRRSGASTVSSMTIGGVSATAVQHHANTSNTLSWWIANVPTGTTATIALTWSAAMLRCGIGVWSLENLQSITPTDVEIGNALSGNDLSVAIDVAAGGGCFAAALDAGGGGGKTFTWAGVTERFDVALDGTALYWSAANLDFAGAQTGLTVSATESITTGTTEPVLSAIALR